MTMMGATIIPMLAELLELEGIGVEDEVADGVTIMVESVAAVVGLLLIVAIAVAVVEVVVVVTIALGILEAVEISNIIDIIHNNGLETRIQINTITVPYPRYSARKTCKGCLSFIAGLVTTYTN